jgi:predicted GH43/DUF377 family glycosyl hydrolase
MLRPDPGCVVVRPYAPGADQDHARARRIVARVLALAPGVLEAELAALRHGFADRHHDLEQRFMRRFQEVADMVPAGTAVDARQALLIGAYFLQEYAYQAAALFNPSIVAHPDQAGLAAGEVRFVLSLRAVGEGHVSSIAFRTGRCGADGAVTLDPPGPQAVVPSLEDAGLDAVPGGSVRMRREGRHALSETVVFPVTPRQRNGIEDLRLVRFVEEDGVVAYYGTYTAFSGQGIHQEMMATRDFRTFDLTPLHGDAAGSKGMALFPRRIDGRYAMLGRQDNETISLLFSDSLYEWGSGTEVMAPRWPWEFVQIGNCGSPIEIEEGWLVLTHGVGAMRNYTLGACLLDRADPTRLLARLSTPLIWPDAGERSGYVPNVIYSCGAMVHGRTLLLPYAIADTLTTFATLPLSALLAAMS